MIRRLLVKAARRMLNIPERTPVVFDFRRSGWGHACQWTSSTSVATHSTPRIQEGDIGIFWGRSGAMTARRFVRVEHCRDPRDMAFAQVELLEQELFDSIMDRFNLTGRWEAA